MLSGISAELRDILFALILFLAGLGYSVMGLPANVLVGCVIWALAWAFVTHLFFIYEGTDSCPEDVKIIFWGAVTFLIVLMLWSPVRNQYVREHHPTAPFAVRSYIVSDGPASFPPRLDHDGQLLIDQNPRVGDPLCFNYYFRSAGPNPVTTLGLAKEVYLEPDAKDTTQNQMIEDFSNEIARERPKITIQPHAFGPEKKSMDTVFTWTKDRKHYRLFTKGDLDRLHRGRTIVFVIIEIPYSDNDKLHHFRMCQFLQPPAVAPGVWHDCNGFEPD